MEEQEKERHTPLFFQPSGLLQTLRKNASQKKDDPAPSEDKTILVSSSSSKYFSSPSSVLPPLPSTPPPPPPSSTTKTPNLTANIIANVTSTSSSVGVVNVSYNSHIIVNPCQKGNRILNYIRNIGWEYGNANMTPDYSMGKTCALFLSLRYHLLHKDYILSRIKRLSAGYKCYVLLCLVDIEETSNSQVLQDLAVLSLTADFTLILAWSNEEAARYIETYKVYENKGPEIIMERTKEDLKSRLSETLTSIKGVNKSDALVLLDNFGSLRWIMNASMEELSLCPGLGEKKVRRLFNVFHTPFSTSTNSNNNSQIPLNSSDLNQNSSTVDLS